MYKRKNNGLILGILFVCLLSLSIGLAALSTTLSINASSTVNASSWDIHFNSITQTGGSTGVTGNPGNIIGGTSIENLQASLPLRGTYIEFTAEIHNEGDFPAFLNYYNLNTNLTCSGGTENENKNVCDYITVTVTGVGSGDLTTFPRMNGSLYNEPLAVNATRQIKIRVDYDKDNQITADKLVNKAILVSGINLTILYSYGTGTQSDADIVNSIKTSSIGSIVTLNNTVGKKLDSFTLYGNTSQNGTPSPTNPVPINVVTGTNTVSFLGKNLFDPNLLSYDPTNFTINGDGSVTILNTSSFSWPNVLNSGKYLTLDSGIYTITVDNFNNGTVQMLNLDSMKSISTAKKRVTTFTLNKTTRVGFKIYDCNSFPTTVNIQLEKNSISTDYEKYKKTDYSLNLGSIELAQIGDAQDSITYEGGKWWLNKQIGKGVFNGSENWIRYYQSNNYYTFYLTDSYYKRFNNQEGQKYYANIYNGQTNSNYNNLDNFGITLYSANGSSTNYIYIRDDRFTDATAFKNFLNDNNLIMYGELATPTKNEITNTNVVNSLNSIKNASTYPGTTNVMVKGNNINPIIQVRY